MLGGHFTSAFGTGVFDPEQEKTPAVGIRVPVNGQETHPSFWRGELLGPHFVDSEHYPAIQSGTARTTRTANTTGDARGNRTVRNVSRPRQTASVTCFSLREWPASCSGAGFGG